MARAGKHTSGSARAQGPSTNRPGALGPRSTNSESTATAALPSSAAYTNQVKEEYRKMEHREKGALKDFSELVGEFFNTERARELAALSMRLASNLPRACWISRPERANGPMTPRLAVCSRRRTQSVASFSNCPLIPPA